MRFLPEVIKMKRLLSLIIPVLLLIPICSQAQYFGDPSNMVGVWQMNLQPGVHLVSFPVLPSGEPDVSEVFGDQLPAGESWETASRILTLENGHYIGSFYNSASSEWEGDLNSVTYNKAYWLVIPEAAGNSITLYLTGAVMEANVVDLGEINPGMNLASGGYPYSVPFEETGLVESGFTGNSYRVTSDRVYKWSAGSLDPVWYDPQRGWQGNYSNLDPGIGYIIVVVPGHDGFQWQRPYQQRFQRPGDHYPRNQRRPATPPRSHFLPLPNFDQPPWTHVSDPGGGKQDIPQEESQRQQLAR